MVNVVYPMINPFSGTMDCFYVESGAHDYPHRFELYDGEWEGGQVPFVGY